MLWNHILSQWNYAFSSAVHYPYHIHLPNCKVYTVKCHYKLIQYTVSVTGRMLIWIWTHQNIYLTLMGKLCVFCKDFGENWLCYTSTALYNTLSSSILIPHSDGIPSTCRRLCHPFIVFCLAAWDSLMKLASGFLINMALLISVYVLAIFLHTWKRLQQNERRYVLHFVT